jgi:hypothetical protein
MAGMSPNISNFDIHNFDDAEVSLSGWIVFHLS